MKKATLIAMMVCGLAPMCKAKEVDMLKPTIQKQEQDILQLLDKLARDGITYEITVVERDFGLFGRSSSQILYNHKTAIPSEIKQELKEYDLYTWLGITDKYKTNPKYSFYLAIISLSYLNNHLLQPLQPIINHNKKEWDENIQINIKNLSLYSGFITVIMDHCRKNLQKLIPVTYQNDVQLLHFVISFHGNNDKFPPLSELEERIYLYLRKIYSGKQNNHELLKWCRDNNPIEKPHYSAVMMGLFSIDGYSFDDETGVYTMNERGKMFMDFIVEFPIPENATRLQAVMNGGNKDEIEAMMKKHDTEEKWQELLENPVHPEFAKYPQDEQ